jgi:hypothetical protein
MPIIALNQSLNEPLTHCTSVTNTFSESEIERMEDLRYTAMLNKDVDTLNRVLFFAAGRT